MHINKTRRVALNAEKVFAGLAFGLGIFVACCGVINDGFAASNAELVNDDNYNMVVRATIDDVEREVAHLSFSKNVSTREIMLPNGASSVSIEKYRGVECNLDELTLDGVAPLGYERKLSKTDKDLIEIADSESFSFNGSGTKLVISARIPDHYAGTEYSFKMPLSNGMSRISTSSDTYEYVMDSKRGAFLSEDKAVIPNAEYRFKQDWLKPGSGHPEGNLTSYVANDDDYLYVFAEVDVDNTIDHGKDFFAVHILQNDNVDSFAVHTVDDNRYGRWWFEYTDSDAAVDYQHMLYLVKIPRDRITDSNVRLAFEYYGTAALEDDEWGDIVLRKYIGNKDGESYFSGDAEYVLVNNETGVEYESVYDSEFYDSVSEEYIDGIVFDIRGSYLDACRDYGELIDAAIEDFKILHDDFDGYFSGCSSIYFYPDRYEDEFYDFLEGYEFYHDYLMLAGLFGWRERDYSAIAGTYTLREVRAPFGASLDKEEHTVVISAIDEFPYFVVSLDGEVSEEYSSWPSGGPYYLNVYDEVGGITLQLFVDDGKTKTPTNGAVYQITSESGAILSLVDKSDVEDGLFSFMPGGFAEFELARNNFNNNHSSDDGNWDDGGRWNEDHYYDFESMFNDSYYSRPALWKMANIYGSEVVYGDVVNWTYEMFEAFWDIEADFGDECDDLATCALDGVYYLKELKAPGKAIIDSETHIIRVNNNDGEYEVTIDGIDYDWSDDEVYPLYNLLPEAPTNPDTDDGVMKTIVMLMSGFGITAIMLRKSLLRR